MTISPSDAVCVYCGGKWNAESKRMEHSRLCYIVTGHMTRAVAKRAKDKRAARKVESVTPTLDLEDE